MGAKRLEFLLMINISKDLSDKFIMPWFKKTDTDKNRLPISITFLFVFVQETVVYFIWKRGLSINLDIHHSKVFSSVHIL